MYISRQRRKRRSYLPLIIVVLLVIGAAYVINQSADLIKLRNPLVPPEPTPTPTRSPLSYLAEAELLYANGQIPEAIEAYAGVTALEPDNDEALRWQARLHTLMGHTSVGVTLAQKAAEINPADARNLATLAMALDWNKQYDEALKTALDALDIDAALPEAHAYLAEIYMDKGIWALALEEAQAAVKLSENSVEAWRSLGYVLDQQGRRDEAVQAYDKAIALHPKLGYLYVGKGYVYLADGDYEKALAEFQRAVNVNPRSADGYDALGWGHMLSGASDRAVLTLEKAIEIDPEYKPAYGHLAVAYYARRNYEKAVELFEKAIAMNQATPEYYYELGLSYIYKEPEDCTSAVPWLRKALEINPDNPQARQGLTYCAQRK